MPTECSSECFDFGIVDGRPVEAGFDGGLVTSDAGALLLGATDRAVCRAQQQRPSIRRDQAAIKSGFHRAAIDYSKIKAFRATLCQHRGFPRIVRKTLWHNNFR